MVCLITMQIISLKIFIMKKITLIIALVIAGLAVNAQEGLLPKSAFSVGAGNVILSVDDELGAFFIPIQDSTLIVSGGFNFGDAGAGILLQSPDGSITGLAAYFANNKLYFTFDLPTFNGHSAADNATYLKPNSLYKIEGDRGIYQKP